MAQNEHHGCRRSRNLHSGSRPLKTAGARQIPRGTDGGLEVDKEAKAVLAEIRDELRFIADYVRAMQNNEKRIEEIGASIAGSLHF